MTLACPTCGRLNRPGARFCASCQASLVAAAGPLQPGQLLGGGGYRVVRPLGKGGMGAVWLVAQTRAFDRLAVLKEVIDYYDPADAEARGRAAERFEAEARTLGELKHPGIPDLYAYFSEAGHNYLVMEYIEGPDLSRRLTREDRDSGQVVAGGPLPADEALRYTIQISEVLEYLAGRRPPVVHNDIKPANIILDSHSHRAVLVDFGTAKARYLRAVGGPDRKRDSVYGTVGYAAPELYEGRSEPRSDVYSLAATAYHLLTDDDPGDHPAQFPHLDRLPAPLASILRAALAPAADDRPTAAEFRERLEGYLAGQTGPLRGLAFPDGDAADGRDELVRLAVRHWQYAAGLLQDGTLARWLRGTLRDVAAAQAAEAAVGQWPGDPDAALDQFLRRLAPALVPAGKMELSTSSLHLAAAAVAPQPLRQQIEVTNRGAGYLRIDAFSTQPWLKVGASFGCPPAGTCAIPVEVDPSALAPGQAHIGAVTLTPAGGVPEVVPVQVSVGAREGAGLGSPDRPTTRPAKGGRPEGATPVIRLDRARVDLGEVPRRSLSTARERLVISHVAGPPARCQVRGAPRWLMIKPESFLLAPGAQQVLELVGRVDRVPGRGEEARLVIAVDGGAEHELRVRVHLRG